MPGRVQGYHKLKENPVWILVIKHTKHKSYHLWAFFLRWGSHSVVQAFLEL